ncbi:MAG: hypothetical protein R3194_08540, partial [Limnobacter sp.]|nr:hypothetical protein [Limnobacter sp.]
MKGHIWLGLLSVPLILFHSGFRWGGPLEIGLMLVFAGVIGSGLAGLVLQAYVPRLMKVTVPAQAIYEQLPQACRSLQTATDQVVQSACDTLIAESSESTSARTSYDPKGELRSFYLHTVRPYLGWAGGWTGRGP